MLSNGFIFALVWDPVENSYINPNEYKATRIDFNKERGKVRNLIDTLESIRNSNLDMIFYQNHI